MPFVAFRPFSRTGRPGSTHSSDLLAWPQTAGLCAVLLASVFAPPAAAAAAPDVRLVEAAKAENWTLVQSLVKQRADVHAAQPDGATALHWAVYWDQPAVVDALLRAGAKVNAANEFGATPLWIACAEGRAAMIDRLLRAGANPNAALLNGETPLMSASRTGSLEAVRLLIARGAQVNAKETARNQTALMWAVAERHAEVTRVLVEAGAEVGARSTVRKMLTNAGSDGLRRLTGDYTDLIDEDQGGYTPLLLAARVGDTPSAKLLVASGARVDEATPLGATPLVVATFGGQSSTAEALLDMGADPNAGGAGYTALHIAVLRGDVPLVKKLLAKGANPNAPLEKATSIRRSSNDWALHPSWVGATPLWLAAKFTDAPLMRALAEAGADAAFVRKDGTNVVLATMADGPDRRSPLFVPVERPEVERRTLEAVKVAADLGANVSATTTAGDTALHAAAARGFNSVIEWLAAKGVSLDAPNKKGLTPLAVASAALARAQQAAQRGQGTPGADPMSTVDLLKKLGASP